MLPLPPLAFAEPPGQQGLHFSFFQEGGGVKFVTNFLGGAKYEEKKMVCAKTQNHYFQNQGEGNCPPPPPK